MDSMFPDFSFEKKFWEMGLNVIAGCDEVGRGCFAGPVVAAAVVFNTHNSLKTIEAPKIDDSKRMTPKQRRIADIWIRNNVLAWGIGITGVSNINRLGIVKAANNAFRRAINSVNVSLSTRNQSPIDRILVDAFYIPRVKGISRGKQTAIVKGDRRSFSIAAASIIAKVYRDKLMTEKSKNPKLQVYGWDKNKGYGTRYHREAILKYGITEYHRKAFISTYLSRLLPNNLMPSA